MNYDFPTAFSHWSEEEHAAIARVMESGRFTMGPEVEAFEHEFAASLGMEYAVMVNSGSSANLIATAALFHKKENPLKRGDMALVPAIAWSTTYAPLVQYGLDLALKDCDETWSVAQYTHDGPARLMVYCPILGFPGKYGVWETARKGLRGHWRQKLPDPWEGYVIEDCCESLGAWVGALGRRQFCGTFGTLSTFSFFHSHQLSAIEGGMVCTNDQELYGILKSLRAHGWTRDLGGPPVSFEDEYNFVLMGYNVRPLEMHAAIAREQLKKLEHHRRARQANHNNFQTLAVGLPIAFQTTSGVPSPFGISFMVENKEIRSRLVGALRKSGIDCRLPTGGSFRLHKYGQPWADQKTPNADRVHSCGLFLGNAPYDIMPLLERAVGVMRETL